MQKKRSAKTNLKALKPRNSGGGEGSAPWALWSRSVRSGEATELRGRRLRPTEMAVLLGRRLHRLGGDFNRR